MSKRILVTGGFGFLGSHLVEALLEDETQGVFVVDNLTSNPVPLNVLWREWGGIPDTLQFELDALEQFCAQTHLTFDEIYHLASVVGPVGVLARAGRIARAIVDDVSCVADFALQCDAKLLYVSTSEVYGGGRDGFCSESMPRMVSAEVTVRSEYAVGKLASEVALLNLSKVTSLDMRIIRPFNIAGPRQSGEGGFVLPRFIAQALTQKPLTVFGDGSQIRAFCHVRDIVVGLVTAMHQGGKGQVYNLGNSENQISILEMADLVIKAVDGKGSKVFVDPQELFGPLFAEARDKFPDTQRAVAELNWAPQYDMKAIVEDVCTYMRSVDSTTFKQLSGG